MKTYFCRLVLTCDDIHDMYWRLQTASDEDGVRLNVTIIEDDDGNTMEFWDEEYGQVDWGEDNEYT